MSLEMVNGTIPEVVGELFSFLTARYHLKLQNTIAGLEKAKSSNGIPGKNGKSKSRSAR